MTDQQPRAVLWDMDGTLIDSRDLHWLSWQEAFTPAGYPLSHERFLENFGRRNDAVIRGFLGDDISADEIARLADAKEVSFRALVRRHGIALLPGARHWLTLLHADGWRQAIASSAPRLNVETILDVLGLGDDIQAVATGEDVRHGKPDPEVFLVAAAKLDIPPARCVVVEDAAAGVEAGRRAGMHTIGVGPTYASLPADISVPSLADLPEGTFARLLVGDG